MSAQNYDVVVVGHFSLDSIKLPSQPEPYAVLGGAVAFTSLVCRRLGSSVAVISKVGADFPDAYMQQLRDEGVDTSSIVKINGEQTTSFELTYNSDLSSRTLKLRRQGSSISIADLPSPLNTKVVHIAPIAGEISYEVVEHLKSWGCCLSIDPQGMTRRFDAEGNVACSVEMNKRLLELIDIYKSSLEEVLVFTGQSELKDAIRAVHALGPKTVIITLGAQGAVLSTQGTTYNVPVYHSEKVVDPTGAGDVFIGGFLAEYVDSEDSLWCACVGSAAASIVVEGIGTTCLGSKKEIYRRALSIYEK